MNDFPSTTTTKAPCTGVVGASGRHVWDLALALVEPLPRGDLLDAGTGGGHVAQMLSKRGYQVTGIDLVNQMQFAEIRFVQADLDEPLPLADSAFDVVTCVEVLGYVENPCALFREFHRILNPTGYLVVTVANILSMQSRIKFLLNGSWKWYPHPAGNVHNKASLTDVHRDPIRCTSLLFLLERSGFEVQSVRFGGVRSLAMLRPFGWLLRCASRFHKKSPPTVNSTGAQLYSHVGIVARKK